RTPIPTSFPVFPYTTLFRSAGRVPSVTSDLGERPFRAPLAVLAAALLFNLGQGVLRPSMPLYLQRSFAANYRMVTLIPVVFGVGKWLANLPTGYLLGRFGSSLVFCDILFIACIIFEIIMNSS